MKDEKKLALKMDLGHQMILVTQSMIEMFYNIFFTT